MIRMTPVVCMAALVAAISPADVVGDCRRDLASIDAQTRLPLVAPEARSYTRYISLYNIPAKDRQDYIRLVDFVANSVSRQVDIEHVVPVPGTNLALLRLDLRQFGLTSERWDEFCKRGSGPVRSVKKTDQPEPFFHQVVKVGGGIRMVTKTRQVTVQDAYGRQYVQDQPYQEQVQDETHTELRHAGWLDQVQAVALAAELHSDYGVIRGDWWIANASTAPGYYELLNFKSLKDFDDFTLYDERAARQAQAAVVVISDGVALHQRGILGIRTAQGYYWRTLDYKDSVGPNDILVNLNLFFAKGGRPKADAGELIANGPNGLQYYLLVDDKDKVLDVAAANVAADTHTAWADKQVWTSVSCVTCHTAGMKDLNDEVRSLAAPPNFILTEKKANFDLLYRQFRRPLEGNVLQAPLTTAKIAHQIAIGEATGGMAPKELSEAIERAFLAYMQDPITMDVAAAEVGCTAAEAKAILDKILGPSHTLRQLQAGRRVRRDQWEREGGDEVLSGYGQLSTLVFQARRAKK